MARRGTGIQPVVHAGISKPTEHRLALARELHERCFAWLTLGDERNLVQTYVAGVLQYERHQHRHTTT